MNNKMAWYNFDTKEYDYITMPETIEAALPYIDTLGYSDGGPARGMFRILVEFKGMDIPNALAEVYRLLIGKPPEKQ